MQEYNLDAWEPEEPDQWKAQDDATVAAAKSKKMPYPLPVLVVTPLLCQGDYEQTYGIFKEAETGLVRYNAHEYYSREAAITAIERILNSLVKS
jgi:hypothetical protein